MDGTSALRVVLSVVLILALILNALFLAFGARHKIGTLMCSHLLRSQTVIDSLLMLVNLINFQYFEYLPQPAQWAPESLWVAYCKLAYSEIFHWSLVCMSVYNLVCLAVERCCCLCAPMWYRKHKRWLAGGFVCVVAVAPFLTQVPYCLLVTKLVTVAEDLRLSPSNATSPETTEMPASSVRRCEFRKQNEGPIMGFGISHVILFWLLPSALSVVLYLLILRKIRRSRALRRAAAGGGNKLSATVKRLTLMTCITSGAFVLLFAMDSITYLLYCVGVPIEKRGVLDSVDSFLVSLNSAVNPLLYLAFMPEFRSFVACEHLRRRWRQRGDANRGEGSGGQQQSHRSHSATTADICEP